MTKADPHEVRDSLVADLVAESAANTGERKGREAEDFVTPILERMERKYDPYHSTPTRANAQQQLKDEASRLGIEGNVSRFSPDSPLIDPKVAQTKADVLLRKRVAWMKSKPDYMAKIQDIFAMLKVKKLSPAQAEAKYWALVAKSDEHHKQAWHNEAKKLHF